jgi:hypothetical protein
MEDVMKRFAVIALLVIVLAASTASADMYGSLRYAGTFNFNEFAFGTQSERFGAEIALGYTKATLTDLDALGDIGLTGEPDLTIMSVGAAVFFTMADNSQYSVDIGGRVQYASYSISMEMPEVRADDASASLTGMSFGPVLRGRWYLADGAMAIGPEIYPKYTAYSTNVEAAGDSADGPGLNVIDLEYSMRLEFYF